MTVLTLSSDFLIERLNQLPPHSRMRAGYCDMLREIRKRELEEEAFHKTLCAELERALNDATLGMAI